MVKKRISISIDPQNIEAPAYLLKDAEDRDPKIEKSIKTDIKETNIKETIEEDQGIGRSKSIKIRKQCLLKYQCHLFQIKYQCHQYLANNDDEGSVPDPL